MKSSKMLRDRMVVWSPSRYVNQTALSYQTKTRYTFPMQILLFPQSDAPLPPVPEHEPVEFVCAADPSARLALMLDGRALEAFLLPGDPAWRWRWNPGAAVGLRRLHLEVVGPGGDAAFTWALRVLPAKIDVERYALLLEDVQRIAASLAYAFGGAATEGATPQPAPTPPGPLESYYALLTERLDALERATRRILARPREHLRPIQRHAPLGAPGVLAPDALARIAEGQLDSAPPDVAPALQQSILPGGGLLPRALPAATGQPTTDIYEHRLLRRVLELLAHRARRIATLAKRDVARLERADGAAATARRERAQGIARSCADALARLRELLAEPLVASAGPLTFRGPTPLLQRDPHYRAVYQAWLELRRTPLITFDTPLLDLPLADLPRLYESWCALRTVEALLPLGELRTQRLVTARGDEAEPDSLDVHIALAEDTPLLVLARGQTELRLRYQPRYRPRDEGRRMRDEGKAGASSLIPHPSSLASLDRFTRVPDLALEVWTPGQPPHVIVLDAKYRLDADGDVPQDALADAYAYLGAIGWHASKATIATALLYPGRGQTAVYASGAATVTLLPGQPDVLGELLHEWIAE
jgi:large subunit ribosomal protein MRP49